MVDEKIKVTYLGIDLTLKLEIWLYLIVSVFFSVGE